MTGSIKQQIRELMKSGRISPAAADRLIEHYASRRDSLSGEESEMTPQINLMELIDLIEAKEPPPQASGSTPEPFPWNSQSPGSPKPHFPENREEDRLLSSEPNTAEESDKRRQGLVADLEKKCKKLEDLLEAEKRGNAALAKMEFVYAKKYADSQEAGRKTQALEKNMRKALEEKIALLTEEIRRILEDKENAVKKASEEAYSKIKNEKEKITKERDQKTSHLEELTRAIRDQESLLNEKTAAQTHLEDMLMDEKKAHAATQSHCRRLEAALLALEKKINEFISP